MIVVAGHVCLDVIPHLGRGLVMTEGSLHEIGPATFSVGGPVGNVGGVLARLGVETRLVGRVGEDPFGRIVESLLGEIGGRMERTSEAATSYSLVISPPEADRYFLHHPGCNDHFAGDDLRTVLVRLADEQPTILHFGYPPIMRAIFHDGGRALAGAFAHASSSGIRVGLDMCTPDPRGVASDVDWADFLRRVLPHVDVFMPSWDDMVGLLPSLRAGPTSRGVRDAAQACLEWGADAVLFKLGDDGCYLRTSSSTSLGDAWRSRELWSANYLVDVRGTTGAGDATNAGFLAGLELGVTPEVALCLASGAGAYSVEGLAASSGVPTLKVLQSRIRDGWERVPSRVASGLPDEATGVMIGEYDRR